MENIFVEFLPPWVETGLQPAFYDKESGTVLQQTARMYARVNMLIRMFNKLSKQTKDEVERFETQVNEDMTQYKQDINETVANYIEQFNELHDYVHDYFDNLDVQEEINNKLEGMYEDGRLEELIARIILRHFVPVEYYGAVGDGITDDTTAINEAITNAPLNSVIIFDQTYKTTDTISVNKKLTLTGGGTIKPQISVNKNAFLVTDDVVISDITIDGSLNTQD